MSIIGRKTALIVLVLAGFAVTYTGKLVINRLRTNPSGRIPVPGTSSVLSCGRIVSLAPSITETLFALGLGESVAGVTRYCKYPPETEGIKKVGGYTDTNYEALISLRPDITIMLSEHRNARKYLGELGLDSLTVNHKSIAGILDSIRVIGKLCGVKKNADRLLADITRRVDFIKTRTEEAIRPRVMVSVGRSMGSGSLKDVYISGRDGFFDEMIKLAGGVNVYGKNTVAFPSVSGEGIMALNPEVIIDMIPDFNEKVRNREEVLGIWKKLSGVDAVVNGRVYMFGQDYVVIPGPRFILTLEQMARAVHPEIEWQSRPAVPDESSK